MQIATWNVNSLKVRLPQFIEWMQTHPEVDAIAIQETKLEDANFPRAELESAGFHVAFAGQKTYNGVALIARAPLSAVVTNIPSFDDTQVRVISANMDSLRLVCAYVPNGQALDSDKFRYKLAWLEALTSWLREELLRYPKLALLGDFNIAPEDRDVHDPAKWQGHILVSPPERQAWKNLLDLGLQDSFRLFEQKDKSFTWWDYRAMGFQRNAGLRIDHILLSHPLAALCQGCTIDKMPRCHERPSDHTPLIATLENCHG